MTTFAVQKGGTSYTPTRDDYRVPFQSEQIVNFASANVPNSGFPAFTPNAVTLSGNAAGDVVQAINIPAGYCVLFAGFEVLVADTKGNSGTLSLTDGTNTYASAVGTASTGIKVFNTAGPTRFFATAGVLQLNVGTGSINAAVRVFAVVHDLNGVNTTIYA